MKETYKKGSFFQSSPAAQLCLICPNWPVSDIFTLSDIPTLLENSCLYVLYCRCWNLVAHVHARAYDISNTFCLSLNIIVQWNLSLLNSVMYHKEVMHLHNFEILLFVKFNFLKNYPKKPIQHKLFFDKNVLYVSCIQIIFSLSRTCLAVLDWTFSVLFLTVSLYPLGKSDNYSKIGRKIVWKSYLQNVWRHSLRTTPSPGSISM